ncbi:MAG: hypothetical protein LC808_12800 [Actinobacteria bacterium]|nr:hypothetical protein [Actinomycetota bacterium]
MRHTHASAGELLEVELEETGGERPRRHGNGTVAAGAPTWARPRTGVSERLWAMSLDERIAAMRAGALSLDELGEWSRRAPGEVPLLDGEWEWIMATTPEVLD